MPIFWTILIAFLVLTLVGYWTTFKKAGRPGWAAVIPVYNLYVQAKIGGKSGWWVLLAMLPYIGWVFLILVNAGVARRFGKSDGFGVGLLFLPFIFWPILGLGKARYEGRDHLDVLGDVFA